VLEWHQLTEKKHYLVIIGHMVSVKTGSLWGTRF